MIRAITTLQIKTDYTNNEAYKEVIREVEVENTARSFNYLTGAQSRRKAATPQNQNLPVGFDPFSTKQELIRGHGNIVAGLGGERPIYSSYQCAYKDLSR